MTWEFPANGDNGSPLREFLIEYKSDFYDQVRVFQRISDTAARYAILNFSPWVIYQLRVVAVNGIGRNTTNSFLTFSTKAITNVPTGKVENLYSRIRGSARNALNIFWKPLSREDENGPNIGYQIRYRLSSANLFTSYRRLGNVSTTFISQLLPNEFYDIQIQAYNRDGVSATIATIKACTCITAPSQGPTNVTSVVISDAVRISWNEIPAHHTGGNLKGYKIRFRSDTTPPRTYNGDVGLVTKYDLRGLAINVRYFLTVRGTIYTPTGLRPVSVNHNNATVQWVIQGSPASFILQYRSSSQSAWSNSTTISGSSRDGIYTNLKAKTQYDLRVVAHYFTLAISPSSSIAISTSDAPVGEQRPFYQQVWFIILVAISGIVLVLIIICSLVMKSRKSERHSGVSHVNSLKDRVPPRPPSPKDENNEIEDAKRPPLPQEAPVIHEYKELEHIDDGSSHDSLDQYGSEHVTGCFDEDGSFIDQYGTTQSKYSGSQHVLHRSASVGSSAFSTLV
ncbi:uncharacterized protein TRIADDRAFT_55088 [Trichoplax adhaerens]|uniref:Fibronectin type-III domain-containing protein n=1 Tax=Trichoplax adhaerens TaxID=10228 RepID=B3RQR5_TRIAD|nr:hypothetical protein TRIADDRAFT_55088 [Trichoplax adhaerens]EDV26748.1 hypothetical protein TRIADDRAFT_55088 [Trichoplax adhaerens]|eukprot:XP_002110744.1 hypothetical protein TRIADDRAFT_55088 [Trichoplax adhaerens]